MLSVFNRLGTLKKAAQLHHKTSAWHPAPSIGARVQELPLILSKQRETTELPKLNADAENMAFLHSAEPALRTKSDQKDNLYKHNVPKLHIRAPAS